MRSSRFIRGKRTENLLRSSAPSDMAVANLNQDPKLARHGKGNRNKNAIFDGKDGTFGPLPTAADVGT
jgi:hypothetical protein